MMLCYLRKIATFNVNVSMYMKDRSLHYNVNVNIYSYMFDIVAHGMLQ